MKMISTTDFARVLEIASKYETNLENKNILFIFRNKSTSKIESLETTFLSKNLLHLTGIIYENELKTGGAGDFYRKVVSGQLANNECYYKGDGTTRLKLDVLYNLVNIAYTAKMIGDYNNSRIHISADKMCGTINSTLSFVDTGVNGYCPSSALKEDIRNLVKIPNQILCIYLKPINNSLYATQTYKKRQFDIDTLPRSIKDKIIINSN